MARILNISIILISIFFVNTALYALEFEAISGEYTQENYIAKSKQTLVSSGDFTVLRSLGIYWDCQKPMSYQTIMTDESVVQINANGQKQIMTDNSNPYFDTVASMIKSLFMLDDVELAKYFDKTELARDKYKYSVKDRNVKKFLSEVEVTLDTNGYIENMKILYANKNTTEYKLNVKTISSTANAKQKGYFE